MAYQAIMGNKVEQVIVLEVEKAKDKSQETEGGKYRRDSPWLVEAFREKDVKSEIIFITREDTAQALADKYPNTGFIGRINPMDYEDMKLDEYVTILKDLHHKGLLLGPVAEHMDRLGTKMILYDLKDSVVGIHGVLVHRLADLRTNNGEIDKILPKDGAPRVLKMMRGSTGLGVWKLENKGDDVILTDAFTQKSQVIPRSKVLQEFCKVCNEDAISMPYLPLIKDGEFRFLMSNDKVLDIVHKKPCDENAFTATLRSGAKYTTLDLNKHKEMVDAIENWARETGKALKFDELPYWWSVDCIEEEGAVKPGEIPSNTPGRRLVLSEINCSCLGLVADTSPEAKTKGKRFAQMIADIVLNEEE